MRQSAADMVPFKGYERFVFHSEVSILVELCTRSCCSEFCGSYFQTLCYNRKSVFRSAVITHSFLTPK